jgi:hypothetical protein
MLSSSDPHTGLATRMMNLTFTFENWMPAEACEDVTTEKYEEETETCGGN